jgi:hypothetical protein
MRAPKQRKMRVLLSSLVEQRRQLHAVLAMGALAPEDPTAVLMDKEIRAFLPSITDAALIGLATPVRYEAIALMRARAEQMLDYASGVVSFQALRKMQDHTTPGDTRLIVEFMKGRGLFSPSKHVSDQQRMRKVKRNEKLEKMSLAELEAAAFDVATAKPEA